MRRLDDQLIAWPFRLASHGGDVAGGTLAGVTQARTAWPKEKPRDSVRAGQG